MNNKSILKIAFPSKGRLRKDLEKLLSNKKINFIEEGNDRNYIAKLSNLSLIHI